MFMLVAEYQDAASALANLDLDDVTVQDTLESMVGDIEKRAEGVAHVVRSLEADAAAIKQWAADATERARSVQARADSLRQYLSINLQAAGIQKVEGPGIAIGWRKSSAVVIDEPGLIPAQFMRQPEPPPAAPDKAAIKAAIKAGEEVPGAHVEVRQSLQVK